MNVGTLTISLTARTASLAKAAGHVKAFEKGVVASVQRVNAAISSVGMAFSALTIPIAAVGIGSTKMFAEFEFSLAKVEGLVGIARDQTRQWGAEILELSRTVGRSANEMGEALYFVSSAGIRGENTMKIVETSAQAAAAGMGESKEIADLLTSAMNAYGEANLSAAEAMDIVVTSVREGKVEASDLILSMGKVLPISSAMGASFNEVGAAIGALTRTGTPARTAGMMVRRMLLGLQKPAEGAKKALADMGGSFDDLRFMVANKEGGLIKALLELKRITDLFGEEKLVRIFPNLRSYLPALDLLGENLEKNRTIWESMLDPAGNFELLLESTAGTFQYKFAVAVNAAAEALIQLGHTFAQNLIPLINEFAEKARNFSDWWTGLPRDVQNVIVKVTILTGVLGPLLLLLSSIVGVVLSVLGGFKSLAVGLAVFVKGALTSTIGAVAALAASLYFLYNAIGDVENRDSWAESLLVGFMKLKVAALELKKLLVDLFGAFGKLMMFANPAMAIAAGGLSDIFQPIWKLLESNNEELDDQIAKTKEQLAVLQAPVDYQWVDGLTFGTGMMYGGGMGFDNVSDAWGKTTKSMKESFVKNLGFAADFLETEFGISIDEIKKKFDDLIQGAPAGSFPAVGDLDKTFPVPGPLFGSEISALSGPGFGAASIVTDVQIEKVKIFNDEMEDLVLTARNYRDGALRVGESTIKMTEEFTEVEKIVNDAIVTISLLDSNARKLGFTGLDTADAIQILERELDKIIKLGPLVNPNSIAAAQMLKRIIESYKEDNVSEGFGKEMDAINKKIEIFGGSALLLDSKLRVARQALRQAISLDPEEVGIEAWRKNVTEAAGLVEQIRGQVELSRVAMQGLNTIFSSMGESLGKMFAGVENGFSGMLEAILSVVKQIGQVLIGIGTSMMLIPGMQGTALAYILGGVGVIAVATAAQVMIKEDTPQVAGMADGGIVPEGYPNDSFNARLTSNEAVIPLDRFWSRLDSVFESNNANPKKVVFHIEGRTLDGVLEEYETYKQNY